MSGVNRFEDLRVWQSARLLVREVYQLSGRGDFGSDFGLRDQVRRAAISVMSNIVEGFHAGSNAEFLRFLGYSRRSLAEVESQLYAALDLEYITQAEFDAIFSTSEATFRQLNSFISYLRGFKSKNTRELPAEYRISPLANPTNATNATNSTNPTDATNATNATDATNATNLTKQPNSLHCFVCGMENPFGLKMEFYTTAPGEVTSWYTVPRRFEGYPGVVHGGIVASLMDEVVGRVHMGDDPQNARFMYTARLTVQYRNPVPIETPLRIVGRALKNKQRTATSKAAIYAPDGTLLAEAQAILVDVPEEMLQDADMESLGWRIYP